MEKLPMCRICLVEDVNMYVVVNKDLHELYERLTDIPFVTKDSRPMLACFFCCTKLKQCYRFLRKCLEAEELFAQMMKEDYRPYLLINLEHSKFNNGFIKSPIVHISIVDDGQTESLVIKEELEAVSERLDDTIDHKEERQTDKSGLENVDNSYSGVENTPTHHDESDSEHDVPLMEIKTEVEEEQGSIGEPVTEKPKHNARRTILEAAVPTEQNKNENNGKLSCASKIIKKSHTSKKNTNFKPPFTKKTHEVNSNINHTDLSTSCRNNSNKNDIKTYQRVSVNKKRFKCDICQRSFSLKRVLTRHILTHAGEKPHKCDICQRSFSLKHVLTRHILTHTGEKPHKCDICQRSFIQKYNLTTHTCRNTGDKPFKCDVCQRSFSYRCYLKNHTCLHKDLFKCEICQRGFSHKSYLTKHVHVHSGEKPFKCDICQSSFVRKFDLARHIRTHTGEKPYKCDICLRRFKRKNHVISHTRLHTDENLFKCDICQRSFNRKSSFTIHIRNHGIEKK